MLKEMARTAKENNNKPLGRERFTKETGIKAWEWGKYWPRYSDFVIEAGYTPNQMQPACDENWLIEQVISFIQEIGRFPTSAEFRIKSLNTRNFPSKNTIYGRLGRRPALASKIINYCEGKSEYLDVYEICKKISDIPEHEAEHNTKESDIVFGYVYLMKFGRYYKIGRSKNVERRNYDLGIKLPEDIKILHKIRTSDPIGVESYWHNRFKDKRRGESEWFDLSNCDISAFKSTKSFG